MNEEITAVQLDVIIVGKPRVGKSALYGVLKGKAFSRKYEQTQGANFFTKTINLSDFQLVKLKLFDISGDLDPVKATGYCSNIKGAVVVCDLTDENALESVSGCVDAIREKCGAEIPIILVGTKSDLVQERKITKQALEQCAEDHRCIAAVEISSKDSTENEVLDIFKRLATAVIEKLKKESPKKTESNKKAKSIPMHDETARQNYLNSSRGIAAARGYAEHFGKIWNDNSNNTPKAKIMALLEDYAHPKSRFAFFKTWSRHHAQDVQKIMSNSNNDSPEALKAKLKKLPLYNTEGMLSHLIHYIENPNQFSLQNSNIIENNARNYRARAGFR